MAVCLLRGNKMESIVAAHFAEKMAEECKEPKIFNNFTPLLVDQYGRWIERTAKHSGKTITFRKFTGLRE